MFAENYGEYSRTFWRINSESSAEMFKTNSPVFSSTTLKENAPEYLGEIHQKFQSKFSRMFRDSFFLQFPKKI